MKKTLTLDTQELRLIKDGLHATVGNIEMGLKLGSFGVHSESLGAQVGLIRQLIARLNAPQEPVILDDLWVAEDGSWGQGEVVIVDTSTWGKRQQAWLEKLSDEDSIDIDDVIEISQKRKPEALR